VGGWLAGSGAEKRRCCPSIGNIHTFGATCMPRDSREQGSHDGSWSTIITGPPRQHRSRYHLLCFTRTLTANSHYITATTVHRAPTLSACEQQQHRPTTYATKLLSLDDAPEYPSPEPASPSPAAASPGPRNFNRNFVHKARLAMLPMRGQTPRSAAAANHSQPRHRREDVHHNGRGC
jgi:hypothetical protein